MTETTLAPEGVPPSASRTLIYAETLMTLYARGADVVVLDCGFDLADPLAGERAYDEGHLPGALYAHLDRDLAGTKTGRNGRHPLPARQTFAERVGQWGIDPTTQVVTYDAQGGPYAARAWWMLHWLGHEAVAVLDGGPAAWRAAGGQVEKQRSTPRPRPPYPAGGPTMPTLDADALRAGLADRRARIVDARAGERYRGEVESLDPVAGHIPGAVNVPVSQCFAEGGRLPEDEVLRGLLDRTGPLAAYCGSGVSAAQLVLAGAALDRSIALYPGSWSAWSNDPSRPVATGEH